MTDRNWRSVTPAKPWVEGSRSKTRAINRWDDETIEQLLCSIQYAVAAGNGKLDWEKVGMLMEKKTSANSIKQYLGKLRETRDVLGKHVPPPLPGGRRKTLVVRLAVGKDGLRNTVKREDL